MSAASGEPLSSYLVADPLTEAVDATLAKMSADADSAKHQRRRQVAWWTMYHEPGPDGHTIPAPQIAKLMREALLARGLSEAQLKGEGVSFHSIRRIVEGPKP